MDLYFYSTVLVLSIVACYKCFIWGGVLLFGDNPFLGMFLWFLATFFYTVVRGCLDLLSTIPNV